MPNFFNDFSQKFPCQNSGACSLDPSSDALNVLLMNEIKQLAFYIVKLSEFNEEETSAGLISDEIKAIASFGIDALTVIILNTAIRLNDYKELLYSLETYKLRAREEYLKSSKSKGIKYELIQNSVNLPKNLSDDNLLNEFLRLGEEVILEKRREFEPKKFDLIEIIIFFAKTVSINLKKLRTLKDDKGGDDKGGDEFFDNLKILKFLNLINIPSNKIEKLKRKICDFSEFSFEIWKKLTKETENKYGKREMADINLEIKEGKSILVSGSDLDELDKILSATEGTGINVYTNSSLFMAFSYPHFKKYKHLVGHFGAQGGENDFNKFKGPVFLTRNFLQKVDFLRRGTFFTTKIIAPDKMIKIKDDDFCPIIDFALNSEGFSKEDEKFLKKVVLKYDKDEIDRVLESLKTGKVTVVIGSYKNEEILKNFIEKETVELDSPIEIQLLIYILEKTKCEGISLVFAQCSANIMNMLLSTLNMNPDKIYFAKCPNAIINPHIIKGLGEEFGVEML